MVQKGFNTALSILKFLWAISIPVWGLCGIFVLLCVSWFLVFKYYFKLEYRPSGVVRLKKRGLFKQLFYDVPRRYVMDLYSREPGFFQPKGIHMFCGEQGCGKTIAAVEMMLRLQKQYPQAKMITNFGVTSENDELKEWQQLLTYTNGHQGVIVGIDEIQNWFNSLQSKDFPPEMLTEITQQRKQRKIIFGTSQVFSRVAKPIREQTYMLYEPTTIFGCITIVRKYEVTTDVSGLTDTKKYRGCFFFVQDEELRNAFDTYRKVETLSNEGFKSEENQIRNTDTFIKLEQKPKQLWKK